LALGASDPDQIPDAVVESHAVQVMNAGAGRSLGKKGNRNQPVYGENSFLPSSGEVKVRITSGIHGDATHTGKPDVADAPSIRDGVQALVILDGAPPFRFHDLIISERRVS
jgi:hypothetical protein